MNAKVIEIMELCMEKGCSFLYDHKGKSVSVNNWPYYFKATIIDHEFDCADEIISDLKEMKGVKG